jgi:hypothetical protein
VTVVDEIAPKKPVNCVGLVRPYRHTFVIRYVVNEVTEPPMGRAKHRAFEKEADEFDRTEHLPSEMAGAQVRRRKVEPKNALAVRFEVADLDRLRARAEAEGVGVTQLVRNWVVERLAEPPEAGAADDLVESLQKSLQAARVLKRSRGRRRADGGRSG